MFKKLFGGSSGNTAAPAKAAPVDHTATIERLSSQCATLEKRINVMEAKIKDAKTTALAKKKAGDTRGAMMAMK